MAAMSQPPPELTTRRLYELWREASLTFNLPRPEMVQVPIVELDAWVEFARLVRDYTRRNYD